MIIYRITNNINGKIYVGQTTRTFKERMADHRSSRDTCIGQAIQKYGWENFTAEIIEECDTIEQLNEREKFWIATLNTISPNGYNLVIGGRNAMCSDELRKRRSEVANKRFENPEERAKISRALTGRKDSEEVRARKSAAQKRRYEENPRACQVQSEGLRKRFSDPNERKKNSEAMKKYRAEHLFSEETKLKISKAKEKYRKKVICIETGEIFESVSLAAKSFDTKSTQISRVCRGVRKTYHGYHFEFVGD